MQFLLPEFSARRFALAAQPRYFSNSETIRAAKSTHLRYADPSWRRAVENTHLRLAEQSWRCAVGNTHIRLERKAARVIGGLLLVAALLLGAGVVSPARAQDNPTVVHVVQPGETLSEIAAEYGASEAEILQLNGIEDANAIVAGQKLSVPTSGLDPSAPAPAGLRLEKLSSWLFGYRRSRPSRCAR